MRSNEERVAEVKRRMEQKKRQEELQRSRIVMISAVAASLLFIAGLSFFMPEIAGQISTEGYSRYEMTASICHNSNALREYAIFQTIHIVSFRRKKFKR